MQYKVAWRQESVLRAGETTDPDGYAPMKFSFNNGSTDTTKVKLVEGTYHSSGWQRKLFASKVYTTKIWLWISRENVLYIYAEPDEEIKQCLKD